MNRWHKPVALSRFNTEMVPDVPGVYDRPPSEEGATLLSRIGVTPSGELRIAAATVATFCFFEGLMALKGFCRRRRRRGGAAS